MKDHVMLKNLEVFSMQATKSCIAKELGDCVQAG